MRRNTFRLSMSSTADEGSFFAAWLGGGAQGKELQARLRDLGGRLAAGLTSMVDTTNSGGGKTIIKKKKKEKKRKEEWMAPLCVYACFTLLLSSRCLSQMCSAIFPLLFFSGIQPAGASLAEPGTPSAIIPARIDLAQVCE